MTWVHRITKSLTVRILVPVLIVIGVVSYFTYKEITAGIDKFVLSSVASDLKNLSRAVYLIGDDAANDLLQQGKQGNAVAVRITQMKTTGLIADFFRANELAGIVIFDDGMIRTGGIDRENLDPSSLPTEVNQVHHVTLNGVEYFSYVIRFEPWNWTVVLLRDKAVYASLIEDTRGSFLWLGIAAPVTGGAIVLVFFLWIWRPLNHINTALTSFSKPMLKGPTEFEEIAEAIGVMMDGLNENSKLLKAKAEELEYALMESNDHLYAIDQHALVAIWNKDGKIIHVNEKLCETSGFSRDEMMGQHYLTFVYPGHRTYDLDHELQTALQEGRSWENEIRCKKKNGDIFWVSVTVVPVVNAARAEIQYIAIQNDITETKETEANLQDAKERAESANLAKTEFLAAMSHEIRTPMNGVIGMASLMMDTELSGDQLHYAKVIKESGESLLHIINDILDFSKLEAGKMVLDQKPVEISDLVEGVVEILTPKAQSANLELCYFVPANLQVDIQGDAVRLRQILVNLVGNAIKFTASGGVTISVNKQTSENQSRLRFEVTDTGIGISSADRDKLFQRFSQVDSSISRQFGGTGLGLAISKRLVDAMSGEIGVESEMGTGSTFWFEIPLHILAEQEKYSPQKYAKLCASRRLLLIDDNPVSRANMERLLHNWNMVFEAVATDQQGMDSAQQAVAIAKPYDAIIFLDQVLGASGLDFYRRLRRVSAYQATPVFLLNASPLSAAEKRIADELGIDAMVRPVPHAHLFNELISKLDPEKRDEEKESKSAEKILKALDFSLRTLVVDDNLINQQVAKGFLKNLGQEVDLVSGGYEAIEAVQNNTYDLVFMDIQMPDIDGLETTRRIRKLDGVYASLPIVAMTANTMEETVEECKRVGMNDYLAKPIDHAGLKSVLQKHNPHSAAAS